MRKSRFVVIGLVERVVGRRNLVRFARFALDYARRDLPNRMATNGEWLIQDVARGSVAKGPLTVLDVGANVGAWSRRLLETCEADDQQDVVVYAFEPSATTYRQLVTAMGDRFGDQFVPVQKAASDVDGPANFYSTHDLAGSNSLHGRAGDIAGLTAETIERCTIDDFCYIESIRKVHLLKLTRKVMTCL